ncbi:MAG: adenylate kinase [Proteobacteria bacterium]|nr:adenylate kinase [Pseudomonadota bacterium]
MKLVLLGPPGAGKGTQARAVAEHFAIPHISTGDIIRATIKQSTPLAAELRSFTESGQLVPDGLVDRMVDDRLAQSDCARGFLLDGYPRTLAQARALDAALERDGRPLTHVVLFELDDALLVERITGRRSDPQTGRIYHLAFDPPPAALAGRLVQRSDDTEAVVVRRLTEYHAKTAPLVPYYESRGLLRRVDGAAPIEQLGEQLRRVLSGASAD